MSYNNYNSWGPGGGDGGGFMGGSQAGASQMTPGGTKGERKQDTVRPVTIKQLLDCQSNHGFDKSNVFKIDDVELAHVTLVGRVLNIAELSTNINYVIDDGTGKIDIKRWVDSDQSDNLRMTEGQWVRAAGQLKSYEGKRHVGAIALRAVSDYNEVQYHILDAVATHLQMVHGPRGEQPAGDGGDTTMTDMGGYGGATMTGAGGGYGVAAATGTEGIQKLSPTARKVFAVIRAEQTDENIGMHVNVISQRSGMHVQDVMKAVDELLLEGRGFTTVDDNHIAVMS